jgi:cell filamentation protein
MRRIFDDLAAKRYLRERTGDEFARGAATFLAELNAIHPFREGNGRTQLTYLTLLAEKAGHPLDLDRLDPDAILQATIDGFNGSELALAHEIRRILLK